MLPRIRGCPVQDVDEESGSEAAIVALRGGFSIGVVVVEGSVRTERERNSLERDSESRAPRRRRVQGFS